MEITTLTRLDARYPILILPFCEFCFSFPFHFSVKNYSFERRTSTGSETFSLYICLDSSKFVLLSFFSLKKDLPESFNQTTPK